MPLRYAGQMIFKVLYGKDRLKGKCHFIKMNNK